MSAARLPRLSFDHIVVAARSLSEGVAYVERVLGVAIPAGGAHPLMGTHNHLLAIGRSGTPTSSFVEVIAPDAAALAPKRRRWFGLDEPPPSPRILTWVARTDDLSAALRGVPLAAGPAIAVSRGALHWRIGVPEHGGMACDGAFPTLIQWPAGPPPSDAMFDAGCRLGKLEIAHPRAREIAAALAPYLHDERIAFVAAPEVCFSAMFDTPSGQRTLR